MDGVKSILLVLVLITFGIVYIVSPLDLLPGLPFDDIVVAIITTAKSVKEIKQGFLQIPQIGNLIIILLVLLVLAIIICEIF